MAAPTFEPGRVVAGVIFATLAIFGGLLAALTLQSREQLRAEVLRRGAESIHAVSRMQIRAAEERLADIELGDILQEFLFDAVLESSHLPGVMGVQLFHPSGALRQSMNIPGNEPVGARWWSQPLTEPEARFIPSASLEHVGQGRGRRPRPAQAPLLDVAVPLHGEDPAARLLGVARYWVDGGPIVAEFAAIDRRLTTQAGAVFVGGALLVAMVLAWAFSRLAEANRRLVEQGADLARANQELDFAAKTGALGAISAHLIHGLKNPLAGLEGFVAETAAGMPDALRGEALTTAVQTTRRLRGLVNEVVTVLRDETHGNADYRVPTGELIEAVCARSRAVAEQAGVELSASAAPEAHVSARSANLVGLVLANVIANAIEASPPGGRVGLEARCDDGANVEFLVSDAGPGLPAAVRGELFRPVRSSKHGGGGVGLAISQRLAKHAGGDLQLVRSDAQGTVFRVIVPAAAPEA